MKSIHKYELRVEDNQKISVPVGAIILSIQQNKGRIFIWAEVDLDETKSEEIIFHVYGTGWELEKFKGDYITTVICGDFVWHIYKE